MRPGPVDGTTLAVWGLAFKPGTDDVRDAPSLRIVDALLKEGAALRLYDPRAMDEFAAHVPASDAVTYASSPEDAADGADAVLILTEWPEFLDADLAEVRERMRAPVIVDGRNALPPDRVQGAGLQVRERRPALSTAGFRVVCALRYTPTKRRGTQGERVEHREGGFQTRHYAMNRLCGDGPAPARGVDEGGRVVPTKRGNR